MILEALGLIEYKCQPAVQQCSSAEDFYGQAHQVFSRFLTSNRQVHGYLGDMKEEYIVRVSFAGYLKFAVMAFCYVFLIGVCMIAWWALGEWLQALFHATFKFEFRPHNHHLH